MPEIRKHTPEAYVGGLHSSVSPRLIVEYPDRPAAVLGTATFIAPGVAITARHCIWEGFRAFNFEPIQAGGQISDFAFRLYQVRPNKEYAVWEVRSMWLSPYSDLALLELDLFRHSGDTPKDWYLPSLLVTPPPIGGRITAYGYARSKLEILDKENGNFHIELNDDPLSAYGFKEHSRTTRPN